LKSTSGVANPTLSYPTIGAVTDFMEGSALILLIDSEPSIREFMTMALADAGYTVEVAADGAQGLAIARSHVLDLIILELRLPVMSGIDFLKAYFALPGPHAPIIALSTSPREEEAALELGASNFWLKPFDLDALLDYLGKSFAA
jgi:two-component system chemotaxis response regulator CheY